ncbi:MAG: YbhB/YbcL family Raf kinase inhibitor-like protein [Gemmatimonadaceae bacterium]
MRLTLPLVAALMLAAAPAHAQAKAQAHGGHFRITSPDIKAGSRIAARYVFNGMGCTGENVSPTLQWSGAPAATKSFAVTVYDPDAPTGSGFSHWVVYNIPASTTSLPAGAGGSNGSLPSGATQGITDFGQPGYGGPCPPAGDKPHRYIFTVFALKVDHLDLPASATPAYVGFNLYGNMLAKTTFTARYSR